MGGVEKKKGPLYHRSEEMIYVSYKLFESPNNF